MSLRHIIQSIRTIVQTGSTTVANQFITWMGGTMARAARYGQLVTITYAASMAPDLSMGNEFVFTITDANAFALANPTNAPPTGFDGVFLFTYRNTSGGAHGAGTFGALYKVSNANFAAVATGFSRTIAFRWDGTNMVEIWRTAADVAN